MQSMLLVDNFDSFSHNLARYFVRLGQVVEILRNDQLDLDALIAEPPDAIVLSPGPCAPRQAGKCLDLVRLCSPQVPILGICLGHQILAEASGGEIRRAKQPMHGRASYIHHDRKAEFAAHPSPFLAGRYHSLTVDEKSLPDDYMVSARSEDHEIMALRHRTLPRAGWQFHPESVLTQVGFELLASFLRWVSLPSLQPPRPETMVVSSEDNEHSRDGRRVITF
jgi:anthranilate synthase/aminodeoxychorismate synthase-like glutamine amidotransferase